MNRKMTSKMHPRRWIKLKTRFTLSSWMITKTKRISRIRVTTWTTGNGRATTSNGAANPRHTPSRLTPTKVATIVSSTTNIHPILAADNESPESEILIKIITTINTKVKGGKKKIKCTLGMMNTVRITHTITNQKDSSNNSNSNSNSSNNSNNSNNSNKSTCNLTVEYPI